MLMNAIDVASGLVLAQLPIDNKDCEITEIPQLLKLLNIRDSVITVYAIGTQTAIMQQIMEQGGHFVMMVKKNQPTSYEELITFFGELETDAKLKADGKEGSSITTCWANGTHVAALKRIVIGMRLEFTRPA